MLHRGDLVPHFSVTDMHGMPVRYATIWQHRNLILIALPASDSEAFREYVSQLDAAFAGVIGHETECVITLDEVPGVGCPGLIVADRWGEIVYVAGGWDVEHLPQPSKLFEWVTYLQTQCPECQGEAK